MHNTTTYTGPTPSKAPSVPVAQLAPMPNPWHHYYPLLLVGVTVGALAPPSPAWLHLACAAVLAAYGAMVATRLWYNTTGAC